jgi:hypothetical protein
MKTSHPILLLLHSKRTLDSGNFCDKFRPTMPLTVLSDPNIRELLDSLTLDDVYQLQASLRQALHEYSTGTQGACSLHQPERSSLQSPNGTTTLFMPSTSSAGIGMKGSQASSSFLPSHLLPSRIYIFQ